MKTAIIYYGGFLGRAGGAFFHAKNIESEFNKLGWKVKIITLDDLPLLFRYVPHIIEKAVNTVYAPLGFLYKAYVTKIMYKLFFDKSVSLRVFEDIYLSWNSSTPSVSMLHAVWSDNIQAFSISQNRQKMFRAKEALLINNINHSIITVSYPYRDYIVKEHFNGKISKELNVVELAVDQEKFQSSVSSERIKKSLIYTGTLEARKNLFFLMDVFKCIHEKDSDYSFTIIGDGPDRGKLTTFATKHNLPVRFLGRVDNSAVLSELFCHETYIHTSVKESFSYSLLEAKLAGLITCAYSKLQIPNEFIDIGFDDFSVTDWCQGIMSDGQELHEFDGNKYTNERMTQSTLDLI
jgi:glycosyltransferase involved in cell wall biosynthesis